MIQHHAAPCHERNVHKYVAGKVHKQRTNEYHTHHHPGITLLCGDKAWKSFHPPSSGIICLLTRMTRTNDPKTTKEYPSVIIPNPHKGNLASMISYSYAWAIGSLHAHVSYMGSSLTDGKWWQQHEASPKVVLFRVHDFDLSKVLVTWQESSWFQDATFQPSRKKGQTFLILSCQ